MKTRVCAVSCFLQSNNGELPLPIIPFETVTNAFTLYKTTFLETAVCSVRYINILTWLRGFYDKLLYLVSFSLCPSLFRELRDKRNFKKLQI